jgi:hypothetical protein
MSIRTLPSGLVVPVNNTPEPSNTPGLPSGVFTAVIRRNLANVVKAIWDANGSVLGVILVENEPLSAKWLVVYKSLSPVTYEELC